MDEEVTLEPTDSKEQEELIPVEQIYSDEGTTIREPAEILHSDKKGEKARKPKKKTAKRKQLTRSKRRGQTLKNSILSTESVVDVAECLFSDEDERAQYLDELEPFSELQEESTDTKEESSVPHVLAESCVMEEKSAPGSRPSSSLSCVSVQSESIESTLGSSTSDLRCDSAASVLSAATSSYRDTPTPTDSRTECSSVSSDHQEIDTDQSEPSTSTSLISPYPPYLPSQNTSISLYSPPMPLIEEGLCELKKILKSPWHPIADISGFQLLLISSGPVKAIKRQIFMSYDGEVENIFVHCVPLLFAQDLVASVFAPKVKFEEGFVDKFIERAAGIVKGLMSYKVCVGANRFDRKDMWSTIPNTYIDKNPYHEEEYVETCRSLSCVRLVGFGKKWLRCVSCSAVMKTLKNRRQFGQSESAHPNTPNVYLRPAQSLEKVKLQHKEIQKQRDKVVYLTEKICSILNDEGVDVDGDLSSDLSNVLSNHKDLSPIQNLFLEQQLKCAAKSDARGYRWHPSMIRLALYIKMVSSSAYEALRDSGAIKLPSSRTLYDYSHPFSAEEGVSQGLLKIVHEKVISSQNPYQQYVCLLCDEMHVSRNLVYRQSDGTLVGYTNLDEVDKEISKFEQFISGEDSSEKPQLANKVLAFLVKGLTSDVKYVIASYACNQLTKDMLYAKAWDVIFQLERAEIKVLAFVSDGSAVNRSFISSHTPITKTNSGIVYDTVNICAPDRRPLFFIADVAHLIKTIRNCFYNSGDGEKKTRCLEFNGEKIVWKTIIRLYLAYKQRNLRKSFKLNAQNVFPNSYSCMKVKFAAEVLSDTVALDIELQNWPGTTETVRFIRMCNKFFDCLNGAYKQYTRRKNANLSPYTSLSDERFDWLESFLQYLADWKLQCTGLTVPPTERAKKMLSYQTLEGIEIAIKGFTGATKFLLQQGAKFVMARAYSQDPLEQHFSRQRAATGGSRNPNVSQFLSHQVSIGIQRDLGVRRQRGNVEDDEKGMKVTNEPVPKRKRKT